MSDADSLQIVRATENDCTDILRIQRIAYRSEAELYNDFSIQPLTQTYDDALLEFQNSVVLKAVSDGRIVGSVRAHKNGGTAFVGKLMVCPDYQNRGIGKRLLSAIENECQAGRYELYTGAKSAKNLALYEKCGYTVFKTEEATPELAFVYMEKKGIRVTK
jgi:GNAT superfamily N-acetyltransferase